MAGKKYCHLLTTALITKGAVEKEFSIISSQETGNYSTSFVPETIIKEERPLSNIDQA
jgi:hypothetical protein